MLGVRGRCAAMRMIPTTNNGPISVSLAPPAQPDLVPLPPIYQSVTFALRVSKAASRTFIP